MITYSVSNNRIVAESNIGFMNSVLRHYYNNTNINPNIIYSIVDNIKKNLCMSGMKFYGEAKCNPEDTFNEKIGKRLAKKRLLVKYNRVLSMVDEELLKVLQNDIDFINRYKAEHKERGKYV